MATGNLVRTDLYRIHNVVKNSQIVFPKELIVGILRDFFKRDSFYHYVSDEWGFPLVPDHTDLPSDAGINDDLTTRVFIGEAYRFDLIYYPAILVSLGSSRYQPISINREKETVKYSATKVIDGYGNEKVFTTPTDFIFAGAWEGNINIDVYARDIITRDRLVELVTLACVDIRYEELLRAGILIRSANAAGGTEVDDQNEKLYKQTVTLEIRSEWQREIPVQNIIDAINICVEFGNLEKEPFTPAPNLTVNTTVKLVEEMNNL